MITENPDRGLARLGVIVPVSNTNLEPDMMMLRPEGVSVHFMRAGGYDLEAIPDSEQMRQFAESSLEQVLDALCAARPSFLLYGCTSATLSHGPQYDRQFCERIVSRSGVPAATAAGALVEAARALDVSTVGFASPYTQQLNAEGAAFLEASGVRIANIAYVGADLGNYGQGELQPEEVLDLGRRADCSDAEAIVLSCTDMRGTEVIEALETELGKPVITSNQAMMYVACKALGLQGKIPGTLGSVNEVV